MRTNQEPHKAAIAATWYFPKRYTSGQSYNDFFDSLSDNEQAVCQLLVDEIENAPDNTDRLLKEGS